MSIINFDWLIIYITNTKYLNRPQNNCRYDYSVDGSTVKNETTSTIEIIQLSQYCS